MQFGKEISISIPLEPISLLTKFNKDYSYSKTTVSN